jgi:UrcA family protein
MKVILTAAWAAVLFITSLPASAGQPEWGIRSVRVDYSDLDLTKAAGVSAFERRTAGAIREVCDEPIFGLREKLWQRDCELTAGSAATTDIEDAVAAAKKLPRTKPSVPPAASADGNKILPSGQQPWIGRNRIPER